MSHLIKAMEQLGSNPALKAKVRINCLNVLQKLGLNKKMSLALITKNHAVTNKQRIVSGFISVPTGYSRILSPDNINNTQPDVRLRPIISKVA
jgi:hypothetical protein